MEVQLDLFEYFPRLPPELRAQIWDIYMPEIRPGVYLFSWRWYLQYMDPDHQIPEFWGVDRTPLLQAPMPNAAFVNREARAAVMRWALRNHFLLRFRLETHGHILTRPFYSIWDTLYVSLERWDEFIHIESDWDDPDAAREAGRAIRFLALPPSVAYENAATLAELLPWMPNLQVIYLVNGWSLREARSVGATPLPALLNEHPDPNQETVEVAVQPRIGLYRSAGRQLSTFRWQGNANHYDAWRADADHVIPRIWQVIMNAETRDLVHRPLDIVPVTMWRHRDGA